MIIAVKRPIRPIKILFLIGVRLFSPGFFATQIFADNGAVSSGRNDVVYLAPATQSYEALPLGNGRLGATVWNEKGMSYQLNHGSFFASPDGTQGLVSSGRLDLLLPTDWMKGFVEERLSLYDGAIITQFKTAQGRYTIKSWMVEGLDALVIQIQGDQVLPDMTVEISGWGKSTEPQSNSRPPFVLGVTDKDAYALSVGEGNHRATAMLAALVEGEVHTTVVDPLRVRMILAGGKKQLTILVANPVVKGSAVEWPAALAASRAVIEQLRGQGLATLEKTRTDYWHSFWSKSNLVLHSEDGFADYLENLYDLFLYWMASSSRGEYPPKFNGGNFLLHEDDRSWGGQYWYNNEREMYWSLPAANHTELMAPFVDLYWNNLAAAQKIAHDAYGATGARFPETMGCDGTGDYGQSGTCLYLTTSTEMAYQMYRLYRYTGDETFLRDRAYPLLKETVTFHLNFVNKEADGLYHVYPSNPRETYHWIKDSVTDLAAMRAVLPALIATSEKLGVDAEERAKWKEVLAHLAPFVEDPVTHQLAAGQFFDEWPPAPFQSPQFKNIEAIIYPPKERTSKKAMNLFNCENVACDPVYPWRIFGLNSPPAELERARQTYLHRPYQELGYGNAWDSSPLWAARLGLPDQAVRSFKQYIANIQMFPSGVGSTPGNLPPRWGKVLGDSPGFDSPGAISTAISEMVLQNDGDKIAVFPAVPQGWQGEFTLAAEGGFLITSKINSDGVIPFVKILSHAGGPCNIVNPWKETVMLKSKGGMKEFEASSPISFATEAGGEYELRPKSAPSDGDLIPVARCDGPKWPQHQGSDDTAEAYLSRTTTFGMLGICRDGSNPARNAVTRALAAKAGK